MPFTGPRIRELRQAANLSREQLAAAADLSFSAIQAYESDRRRPSVDNAERIAAVLGVTVDELLDPLGSAARALNERCGRDHAITNTGVLEDVAAVVAPSPRASSEAA